MFAHMPSMQQMPEPQDGFTPFTGGLDQETPAWIVPIGRLRDALNYEVAVAGGYIDIRGYERFDGQAKPSDASFTILDVTVTGAIAVGDTVTGAISGATGLVIAIDTYPELPDQTYLALTKVTGTFDEDAEDLTVGGVVQGNTDAAGYADSAPTSKRKAQYRNLAADAYRADIAAVPGEGAVWGGFALGNDKYAIRNKVGGLSAGLYKATPAGWVEVNLGVELAFTAGVDEIHEGDVITGATSGATATVERVQRFSGDWGSTAAGWLTLSGQAGNFQAEGLEVNGAPVATIAGDSQAITLNPGGRLDHDRSNFTDPQGPLRVYGADGVNFAFEFDGAVFARIRTGMPDDTPDHIIVHSSHLIVSFDASVQISPIGNPFDAWTVVLGAGEITPGSRVTGFRIEPGAAGGAALLVASRQRMHVLYGNDTSDFNLVPYRHQVGAYEWTIQQVAYTLFLDDRGITDLRTAQTFGNFQHSALSNLVRRLVNQKRTLAVASTVVRDKNQYRLFFSDNSAIYVTMAGPKVLGMMPITLGHKVTTVWSEEDADGKEEVFFGSDNGFVYQMERGTSFDGDNIRAFLYTHFDHQKSIGWVKEYFAPVTVQGRGSGYAEFDLAYELEYGDPKVAQPDTQTASMPAAQGATWDSGLQWDTGIAYDNASLIPTVGLDLRGEGTNISWIIVKDSDYFEPLLLSGMHYRFLRRHPVRG